MNSKMKIWMKGIAVMAIAFLSVGIVNGQQKIGHVNSEEIIQAMPEFTAASTELETLSQEKQTELQSMFAEYQRLQTEAQEKYRNRSEANADSIDSEIQRLSLELQDIEQRIQENQQRAEEELRSKQDELMTPIFQRAGTAVQNVAKELGYSYVFDVASTNIPYFQGGEDLTEQVKTKLGITSTP